MIRRQRGMALVVVLWLVVLLSIMAAGHSRNTKTDTQLTNRQLDMARARGMAEAGINHVILEMLSDRRDHELPLDGTVFGVEIYGTVVTLAVRRTSGLVDLNAADAKMLDALLSACGVDEPDRPSIIDAILDWRDRDDLRHLNGIEDEDYFAAGLPWSSRDGAFQSIDELKYLPGIDQGLYERLAPLVTLYSGKSGIDLELAPPILVAELAGDEIVPVTQWDAPADDRRRSGTIRGNFHVYASVPAGSGTVASLEAVVSASRSSKQPVRIREWREPARQVVPPLAGDQG